MSKSRTTKIRRSARDEDCMVRIPSICNFDPETTVLAPLNGGGAGMKHNDIHAAYCCSACHDVLDGRIRSTYSQDELKLMHLEGMVRTQLILIDKGLINDN